MKWVMSIKMHTIPSPLSVSGKAAELQRSMGVMHFTLHMGNHKYAFQTLDLILTMLLADNLCHVQIKKQIY